MYRYKVTIVKVIDGDTVDVDIDLGFSVVLKKQRVRLYEIDTPVNPSNLLISFFNSSPLLSSKNV